jgi:hypothetical protein
MEHIFFSIYPSGYVMVCSFKVHFWILGQSSTKLGESLVGNGFITQFYYFVPLMLLHVNDGVSLQPLAPICELCSTQKPEDVRTKYKLWSCKFCTLENSVKSDKCSACGQWRYSHGPPVSVQAPNRGT